MDTEYLQLFDKFHKERLSFLSGKDKHLKCKGCDKIKQFTEKDGELIFSCGSTGGDCGQQIKIQLPKYIHFNDKSIELRKNINGTYGYSEDIQDITGYNLETLNRYMKIKSELDDQNKLISGSEEEYSNLKKGFIKLNGLKERMKDVQDLYQLKRKESLYKDKLMRELKNDLTSEERKKDIRREYAGLMIQNQKDILPLFETLREKNQMEIQVEDPILEITIKKKEKKKKIKKTKKDKPKGTKGKIDMDELNKALKDALKGVKIEREEEDPRGYEMCKKLAENKISKEDIQKYREKIHKKILKKVGGEITIDNFKTKIGINEMKYMFELYDKYFFKNELVKFGKELGCMWTLCWNNRCTNAAGRQRCTIEGKCKQIEIELSAKVFDKAIRKLMKSDDVFIRIDKANNCDSVLSCFTFTFEHELVHSLLSCFCPRWNDTNKGAGTWTGKTKVSGNHTKTFMSILNNTFGHVNFIHGLFLSNDEFSEMFEGKKKKKKEKPPKKKEPKKEEPKKEPEEEKPPKKKGLGDELEDLQVEIIKGVSKAEQEKK